MLQQSYNTFNNNYSKYALSLSMNLLENTLSDWSKKEVIWLFNCIILTILTAYLSGSSSFILVYSIIGITNLVLAAKGKVFNYVLGLIGVLMYALISYQNHVYGQLLLAIFFCAYTVLRLV